jgi:ABC-2 type transport system ATP-binding protein
LIQTQNLTRRFGDILAVDRLTLKVEPGEIFGFLGPNGAGKTTTIRMLAGLIAPSSGEATVAGCRLGREDSTLRRRIGVLTETPGLYDGLSAQANLAFFAELYGVPNPDAAVNHYLAWLGLSERRFEAAGTFSKGMRQKLAIARALLHEPQVVFLDEPTSGLDPEAAHLVRDFIAELRREGRTIFLCTHNLDEADRLCDRIGVFRQRLLALDTPSALRRQLFGRTVVVHLRAASPTFTDAAKALDFVQEAKDVDGRLLVTLDDPEAHNPDLIRALVASGADVQFVGELRQSLEDVYLRLVGAQEATT